MTPHAQTFWDHLDVLRGVLLRCLLAWLLCTIAAFFLKDFLFTLLFAPAQPDFILYRWLCRLGKLLNWSGLCIGDTAVEFINTELAAQFLTHLQVSVWGGLLLASPYLLYQCYGFVAPALYQQEKRYTLSFLFAGTLLFLSGVLLNYFLIFPFSFRFLSTYQVQAAVVNMISLNSYISSFLVLSLLMGMLFEIPILTWLLARLGIITPAMLRQYRKHVFVGILIFAAVITPTGDIFTLLIVTLPVYLLYEFSILVIRTKK